MNVKVFITLFISALALIIVITSNQFDKEMIIATKIYNKPKDVDKLFIKFNEAGINTIFGSTEFLSDETIKRKAKDYGISTFGIFPIFYDPIALAEDSTLWAMTNDGKRAEEEWVKFVCPSSEEFKSQKIEYMKKFIEKNDPTGISLDFIRHFVFWEKVYLETALNDLPKTCFDKRCVSNFLISNSLFLPNGVSTENEIHDWIQENHFNEWVDWKNKLITDYVRLITMEAKKIKPSIKVNIHAVPWREDDYEGAISKVVGQDFEAIAKSVDYISPMTYSHMLKRKPEWIHSVVQCISKQSNTNILPSIQVSKTYLPDPVSTKEFGKCLDEALKEPSHGVVFWNWEALAKNKAFH